MQSIHVIFALATESPCGSERARSRQPAQVPTGCGNQEVNQRAEIVRRKVFRWSLPAGSIRTAGSPITRQRHLRPTVWNHGIRGVSVSRRGFERKVFGSPGKTRTYSTSVNRRCTSCSWESPPRWGPNASGAQPKYFFAATSQFVISPTLV